MKSTFLIISSLLLVISSYGDLQLNPEPIFLPTRKNVTVGPGERAVLSCRIKFLGAKTVIWKKTSQKNPLTIGFNTFVNDPRIKVDYSQRDYEWSLIINNVRPSDEGVYKCDISTKFYRSSGYSIRLNVKKLQHPDYSIHFYDNAVQITGKAYIDKGDPIHLTCNATAKPRPPHDVLWFRDGLRLRSDMQRSMLITKKIEPKALISVLVIKSSKMEDAGDYVCRTSQKDSGMIRIHILNVGSSQIKRGAKTKNKVGYSYSSCDCSRSNSLLLSGTALLSLWYMCQ